MVSSDNTAANQRVAHLIEQMASAFPEKTFGQLLAMLGIEVAPDILDKPSWDVSRMAVHSLKVMNAEIRARAAAEELEKMRANPY